MNEPTVPSDACPASDTCAGVDFYTHNADLYGALSLPNAEAYQACLATVLEAVDIGDEAVIDVGAGVGTSVGLLAARFPDSALVAVEPSSAMRAGLMTLVALRPELRSRVTVAPGRLEDVLTLLPRRWGLVTVLNAIGHLDDDERHRLWLHLGVRLVAGGAAVFGLQPPATPEAVPWTAFGEARVGTLTYGAEGMAEPDGHDRVTWTMRWTVRSLDGSLVEQRQASTSWKAIGPAQLAEEAIAAGLRPAAAQADFGLHSFVPA